MPFYQQVGEISKKRHTRFRQPDGFALSRGVDGRRGISYDSALLYLSADGDFDGCMGQT